MKNLFFCVVSEKMLNPTQPEYLWIIFEKWLSEISKIRVLEVTCDLFNYYLDLFTLPELKLI